ncbi:MAG: site-specific DNA-methyltransferase [Dehalococcoidia bacterium]|nr:site-specific DNA-methyltransferase [Dehalococcoidia bacterium]
MPELKTNVLYYGDNLDVLRAHIPDGSVDLIYLDPPFNSNASYNVLFKESTGKGSTAQIQAFTDTWHWDDKAVSTYSHIQATAPEQVRKAIVALFDILSPRGQGNEMIAYLVMMTARLVELHRVLKPTGSPYLHCDPTASHYLKVILDAVFGPQRFINEIVWKRYGTHNDVGQGSRHFGRVHDILLLHAKDNRPAWNQAFIALAPEYVTSTYRHTEPETGRRFTTTPLTDPGGAEKGNPVYEWKGHTRAWRYSKATMERLDAEGRLYYSRTGYARQKLHLDESRGVPVQDVWEDIGSLSGAHKERQGYATQKPLALLERIISASTNEGDVVLDPFCGCGTAEVAAQKLNRRWIGIDVTNLAITVMRNRLEDGFPGIQYEVIGLPTTLSEAQALASQEPEGRYQFQWWAVGRMGALPAGDPRKKGADRGIDGLIGVHHDRKGRVAQVVVQAKSGHVTASQIRDLKGVCGEDKLGLFITLEPSTGPMRGEASGAGLYYSPLMERHYPKIQILTIEQFLEGKRPEPPPRVVGERAPLISSGRAMQMALLEPAGNPPETNDN